MTATLGNPGDAIAIVGVAARLPGARNVREFWHNLRNGTESVEHLDPEVARKRELSPAAVDAPGYRPVTATADDLDLFDPEFFGFTQREAELCDPQFRLFLELSYTALNDAGYDPRRIGQRVGVFGGATTNRYRQDYIERNRSVSRAAGLTSMSTGNNADYIAPLVSYRLGFMGPSVSVYTACSTSLVAVHQAMQALRRGECDVAVAGGVQVDLPLGGGYPYLEGGILSRDGHVRPFAADATGTIFADGGALVVLKPLAAAQAAGDQVYAVIRGSAVNNDGNQRAGFTAPGVEGQLALIRAALDDARVGPEDIGMVEAHGTGTRVGDPIEVAALSAAYQERTDRRQYCWLGSVKGNVGHLGPAAGTVGLIKAILAVRDGVITPTINCTEPNPAMDLPNTPFVLAREVREWADPEWRDSAAPRIAAVSSFGIGGTNAHVIVEQPPAAPAPAASPAPGPAAPQLWPVSARSADALAASCAQLAEHLRDTGHDPADVAFTLQEGRAAFAHRKLITVTDPAAAVAELAGEPTVRTVAGIAGTPQVTFLFPGQGAQFPGSGRELYRTFPVYRDAVDTCADQLAPLLGFDLRELLDAEPGDERAAARLNETAVTQPALFTVEWALAQLLISFGVRPAALLGHSIGEIVAATVAGVFTLPDALTLVARRGQLMQGLPPGGMLSLSLGADAVREMLPSELDIAASNSPSSCVVSGELAAVEQFAQELADIGITASLLRTSHAFHSRMMAPICDELAALVESFPRQAPRLRYLSNVTGDWITEEQATSAAYWATHVRQEVRLESCLARLDDLDDAVHLQVGPGQSMSVFARQYAASRGRSTTALTTMALPNDTTATDATVLATTLGRLWVAGAELDWSAVRVGGGRRVSLPGYPYERRRCWVDPDPERPGSSDDDVEVSNDPLQTPLYLPAWRAQPVARRDGSLLGETWLVLADADDRVGAEIVAEARRRDVFVLPAYAGPGFVAAPDGYEFDPDRTQDVELLVEAVHESGLLPDRIVYALFDADDDPQRVAHRAYHRMAALAKALLRTFRAEVELVAVTDRVWSVNGEPARPEGATVAGPLRTLPRELGTVRVRQVDVAPTAPAVAATVVGEIGAGGDRELVALRGHRRWVHHHASIPNEPVRAPRPAGAGGVLLVTGGLGGLGLAIAEDLAARQRTDFALVGRSGLPDRDRWDDVDAPVETRERIAAVRRIEATGSRVLALAADVTDADAMATAVERTRAELGPITGIVHAAGLPGGQLLALHDAEAADRVLAPKVRGTLVLDALVQAGRLPELDFVALFSSIVSVSADYGHSDYAAANTFLDAYAAARADDSPYVVAINWWGWQEVGMVSTDRAGEGFRTLQRLRGGSAVTPLDHPLLHRASRDGDGDGWTFEVDLDVDGHWVLTDHRIGGVGVLPGTSLLEMAHAAARHALGAVPVRLTDVVFIDPVRVTGPLTGVLTLVPVESGGFEFAISFAAAGQPATVHCRGRVSSAADRVPARVDVDAIREELVEGDAEQSYSGLVEFGERFRAVSRYWNKDDRGLVELDLPAVGRDDADRYALHPALLDRAVYGLSGAAGHSYLPFLYRSVEVRQPIPQHCWVVQTYHGDPTRPEFMEVDELVVDADGTVCVVVEGYTLRSVDQGIATPARPTGEAAARGTGMLTNAEGGELFRRIMGLRPGPQVITSVGSLPERLARARTFDQHTVEAAETVAEPVRTIGTTFVAPQTPVQRELAQLWCESLGLTQVGIDDDFFLLGGSSLTVVQLASRIRERLSVELSAADMFEYPTIRRLAGLLDTDGMADGIS
ncbi:SDR family NAD(P)-dependent oxidoreductase [Micromonospora sp. CPCC 205546]|uniref:type I polyketide synthase n=1 Tax=Micromonospora sp. CPCC 205546 TaxID=3122397 RepID=UPI002FF16557